MYTRALDELVGTDRDVEWGNGTSYRLLIEADGLGYSVCHTIVRAGTTALLEYRNHRESCYCIAGEGEIEDAHGRVHPLRPGVLYVLERSEPHHLRGAADTDLVLVSIFSPPLKGDERHDLTGPAPSSY